MRFKKPEVIVKSLWRVYYETKDETENKLRPDLKDNETNNVYKCFHWWFIV
jgi:hypothetical protein